MRRREGNERVEHMQSVYMPVAYGVRGGEIDIGVGEARIELDRAARHALRSIVRTLVIEQIGKVAVGLGVIGPQRKRRAPALLRLGRKPEPFEGVGEVVERLRVVGVERQRPLEAKPALVELQHLLQDDAEIVPGGGEVGRERHRPPSRLFALGEQPLLAAHLGEVAEVDRRRARRSAGLAHMRDRKVEITERVGHEAQEIGRVRLARPHSQHLPAEHLRFVRPSRRPCHSGALNGLCDIGRGRRIRAGRNGHLTCSIRKLALFATLVGPRVAALEVKIVFPIDKVK
jgi:hypothetical protein